MRTRIETTNRVMGMLECGGVCGRIISYPASVIADIMDCTEEEAATMDGSEIVPRTEHVTLIEYVDYVGIVGHVIRCGDLIQ